MSASAEILAGYDGLRAAQEAFYQERPWSRRRWPGSRPDPTDVPLKCVATRISTLMGR